jgi:hypothetical protein
MAGWCVERLQDWKLMALKYSDSKRSGGDEKTRS